MARNLSNSLPTFFLLSLPISGIWFLKSRSLKTGNDNRVGYADVTAIRFFHRRMGLMNAIPDEFRRNHVDIVNLNVPSEREAAVGLCWSLGFSIRACSVGKRLT